MRGKYLTPMQALRFGAKAIRNSFRDQLVAMRQEGLDNIGETPCLMSEIGIPYDMEGKQAYKNGDYAKQYAAMDANNYALENAGLSYTLWCYCSNVLAPSFPLTPEFTQMGRLMGRRGSLGLESGRQILDSTKSLHSRNNRRSRQK
jgi:hypothetical protein